MVGCKLHCFECKIWITYEEIKLCLHGPYIHEDTLAINGDMIYIVARVWACDGSLKVKGKLIGGTSPG
jgi:hypothetical protein